MLSPSVTRTLIDQVRTDAGGDRAASAKRAAVARSPSGSSTWPWPSAAASATPRSPAELYLSVPTVKAHVSRLFEKLEVTNRVQIAICVHDAGLNGPQNS